MFLSSDEYTEGRQEAVVSSITGNTRRILTGDYLMVDWEDSGLIFPSVVTGVLRTVDRDTVAEKLGVLGEGDLRSVDNSLRLSLAI